MARESKPPEVDGASDYVAVFTPETELDPGRVCLVIVDMQYATGSRTTGLGKRLAAQGKLEDAEYRFSRIEEYVVPNTKRLLDFFRAHDLRRVFLTYGSEVSDYSDLPEHVRELCEGTNNRVGEREHEIIDELKPLPNERVFNKIGASAFNSTPIDIVLRVYGVDTLLFAGVSTNMCVEGACATPPTTTSSASWSRTPAAPTALPCTRRRSRWCSGCSRRSRRPARSSSVWRRSSG